MITESVNFTIRYDAGNLIGLEIPQTLSAPDHAHAVKYLRFYEGVRDAGSLIHGPVDAYRIIGPVTITQHRPRLAERAGSTFTAKCPECGRVFDLINDTDAQEWAFGHDCEVN